MRQGQRISETEIAIPCEIFGQLVRESSIKLAEKQPGVMSPQRGVDIGCILMSADLTAQLIREAVEVDLARRVVERRKPVMMAVLDEQTLK